MHRVFMLLITAYKAFSCPKQKRTVTRVLSNHRPHNAVTRASERMSRSWHIVPAVPTIRMDMLIGTKPKHDVCVGSWVSKFINSGSIAHRVTKQDKNAEKSSVLRMCKTVARNTGRDWPPIGSDRRSETTTPVPMIIANHWGSNSLLS